MGGGGGGEGEGVWVDNELTNDEYRLSEPMNILQIHITIGILFAADKLWSLRVTILDVEENGERSYKIAKIVSLG